MSLHTPARDVDRSANAAATSTSTGSALLGIGAVVIWNDVAPQGRQQFYDWHDKEHIPERLAIPGFRRGRRYARPGHSPEWLTLYEADDLGVVTSPAYLARLNSPTPQTTKTLDYFRNTSRAVCRLACSRGSSSGGHVLAMRLDAGASHGDALADCMNDTLFATLMAQTGVVACHLFRADDAASHVRTAESQRRQFDVPSWVLLVETTTSDAAERARGLVESADLAAFGVTVRGDAAAYSMEICRLAGA
jgi:hypothetical protein